MSELYAASVDDDDDERKADDSCPSREDQDVFAIFLSHSGKQKAFVENLYNALQRANRSAFFDKHTLPKGSPFPANIRKAACSCKLGVVVLSNEFLISKWPMRELEMFVMKRGPDALVLPVFYKLSPQDLKSFENISKWQQIWKENAQDYANQWEQWGQAVKALDSFNGEVFTPGTSEASYIDRVVRVICNLVPSPTQYDLSPIKGQHRLAKEVARQFDNLASRPIDNVCMVGLHGVGGLGKTTICKIMGNFYHSQYPGKWCLIEFPSDNDDRKIVQECKKALKRLANLSDENLLSTVDDFDEVIQLMKENMRQYDVFLAIDNVWESSREKAKRILGVGFTANSKILLTSRSEEVLKNLLSDHKNTNPGPLPCANSEEAFQIFQETFKQETSKHVSLNLVNRNLLDIVLKRCLLSGSYHALALKSLSQYVKSICELEGSDKIEQHLLEIFNDISSSKELQIVEKLIGLNYTYVQEHKQHMFLDIVVVVMDAASSRYGNNRFTYAMVHQWLSLLYKELYSKKTITNFIYELALDGLIQLENEQLEIEGGSNTMIRVHDLYSDLAWREAASSPRFFTYRSTRTVEKIEWECLERVILRHGEVSQHFVEELQQQECQKLQVLFGDNIHFKSGIDLNLLPSLSILKVVGGTLDIVWSAATALTIVHLYDLKCTFTQFQVIPCLELFMQQVETVEGHPNLDGCKAPPNNLVLGGKAGPTDQISGPSCSKRLELIGNESMEEVGGLSPDLKEVRIVHCGALKKTPDLSGLICLERLELGWNESMEEVAGLSPSLKEVNITGCGALRKMPDLSGLTCLERLELGWNGSMEEGGGLSPALKEVRITGCKALRKMPDLSGLTCLERLELGWNDSMEEMGILNSALKEVRITGCKAMKKMPDLSGLTCLELLELGWNESMEEVGGLSPALKEVRITGCKAMKKMPDLSGLTRLERLGLGWNESMEEVGALSPALKEVRITFCKALKKMPDLTALTCLEQLELTGNGSTEDSVIQKLINSVKNHAQNMLGAFKKKSA